VLKDSGFRRLDEAGADTVALAFEGSVLMARSGDTVAAAMLAAGHFSGRDTPISGAPRGPFCMMGACFDCLVEIDGAPNRQACMTIVAEGMKVHRMKGARPLPANPLPSGEPGEN
jgi:predicted molibdopterin-dependent oxidoreductase YjgC